MAKKDRMGKRKTRDQRKSISSRTQDLGYYLIVTDTEGTERCYFEGLYNSLPKEIKDKIAIKVIKTDTKKLVNKCLDLIAYDSKYRMPWIVFDRDQVPDFDSIIDDARKHGIEVGWSNPCFEIWMFAYYGSMPNIQESWTCCSNFGVLYKQKTGHDYNKTDAEMYCRITKTGNEKDALKIAQKKLEQTLKNGNNVPSKMISCTTVHKLVGEIKSKADHSLSAECENHSY